MPIDTDAVTTLTFDSYSTLVDVEATRAALADRIEEPAPVSRLWRTRSIEYTLVGNHLDIYKPFYEINRDALEYALAAHGVELSDEQRDEILSVYHELEVFEDVRPGLERLSRAGYDLYVLSNGDPGMLDSLVEHADIEGLIEDTISAHEIERFKPDSDLYAHAATRTDTPAEEIAHASALWFDVQGANHAGMQAVRMDRKGRPWERFGPGPDLTVETIHGLADELGA